MNNGENTRDPPIQTGSSIDQQWRGALQSPINAGTFGRHRSPKSERPILFKHSPHMIAPSNT